VLGTAVGRIVLRLRRNRQEGVGRDELLALGLLALAYGSAELVGAYGFLAVFVAGIALRRVEWRETEADDRAPEPHELPAMAGEPDAAVRDETAPAYMAHIVLRFSEQLERAAEAVAVVVIGVLLLVLRPPWEAVWFVPLLLLAVRPVAVVATLLPLRPRRHDVLLAAWFGIRGVGSMYYLSFALVAGVLAAGDAELVTGLVLSTVAASIVLHGISVTPLMARREERKEREGSAPTDDEAAVDDAAV
jgi:NhaP-type Na+/H+ or K+/H+ antiporter